MLSKWAAKLSFIALMGLVLITSPAQAIELNAQTYVVGHPGTGRIVLAKEADTQMAPASLTKMMTLYLLFDAIKRGDISLEDHMLVSEKAWRKGGSKMFVEVGDKVRVDDLIKGIAVSSGNDACIVVAEHIAGSEEGFAQLMTEKARQLGMENSTFKNASGWPQEGHMTTARDMFILADRLVGDFPEYYHYFSIRSFEYAGIKQSNRNGLLRRDATVDGLKTGHTEEAGYHLVSSAERDDLRLISVVMGTNSMRDRENQSLKALGWAFGKFDKYKIVEAGSVVEENAPVWMGQAPTVPLVATETVPALLSDTEKGRINAELVYESPIKAPVKKGDKVGELVITFGQAGVESKSVPIVAGADVREQGLFGKITTLIGKNLGL